MITKDDAIAIKNDIELKNLIQRFKNGPQFAEAFVFENDDLYNNFFEEVGLSVEEFKEKYYYYNQEANVHISESESGFVWISTMGLVATSRVTQNKYVNAFLYQVPVLMHLLDEALSICNDEQVYDIDSYHYEKVEEYTPVLFNSLLFFSETLLKSYISLQGERVPYTHKIETLLKRSKEIMFREKHNDTLFHARVIPMMEEIVLHISSIPSPFKEQFVKYDDNPYDSTLMVFRADYFQQIIDFVNISFDIILDMYYSPDDKMYWKQGLYGRLLEKCETTKEKDAVKQIYQFLENDR